MRHPAGVFDQRLHRTERLREREQLGPARNVEGRGLALGGDEAHHATEGPHLALGDGMTGVGGEPRIQHPRHRRVGLESSRDDRGGLAVTVHAHRERLDATQHEVAVERSGHRAGCVLDERELVAEVRICRRDEATDRVRVSTEIFRGGVHDDIGAERERLLKIWRCEGVVDDNEHAVRVRNRADCRNVHDAETGIGRRLDPHDARVRRERLREPLRVGEIGRRPLDANVGVHAGDEAERSAVGVARQHHVIAGLDQRAQHRVFRGHAAGEREAPRGAFERGETRLERGARRVAGPAVFEPGVLADGVLGERRGQADRGDDCARRWVSRLSGMNRVRLESASRRRFRTVSWGAHELPLVARYPRTSLRLSNPTGCPPSSTSNVVERSNWSTIFATGSPMPIIGMAGLISSRTG